MTVETSIETLARELDEIGAESREAAERMRPGLVELVNRRLAFARRARDVLQAAERELGIASRWLATADAILHPETATGMDGLLRGKVLAQTAIDVLRESGHTQPIHYTAWYELLLAHGHRVAGADPVATFLTTLARDDRVQSIGARSGLYRLREERHE